VKRVRFEFRDLRLAEMSPGHLSSPAFWPTVAMGALLCPLLSGALAAGLLRTSGTVPPHLAFCLMTAASVAWTGGLACGSTVSVAAATVGAVPLTAALTMLSTGLVTAGGGIHGLATRLAATPLRIAALGGLPTLVPAPAWRIALVDAGIILLSLAMAAARRGTATKRAGRRRPLWILALLIALSGPGLVAGLSYLFEGLGSSPWQLAAALALIGGMAFAASLALQEARVRRRAASAGTLYAVACLLIPSAMSALHNVPAALLVTVIGVHVVLQGTFFSLAYLLGERLGGVWWGAMVSAVEGVAGYTGFLLATHAVI